jgi:hypothetical protein
MGHDLTLEDNQGLSSICKEGCSWPDGVVLDLIGSESATRGDVLYIGRCRRSGWRATTAAIALDHFKKTLLNLQAL